MDNQDNPLVAGAAMPVLSHFANYEFQDADQAEDFLDYLQKSPRHFGQGTAIIVRSGPCVALSGATEWECWLFGERARAFFCGGQLGALRIKTRLSAKL